MPAVLVHGVPDTPRLWDGLRSHLTRRDIVTPALPGFASPLPARFDATKEAYVGWLTAEIEALGEPVDLVGHDWGSILAQRTGARLEMFPDSGHWWPLTKAPEVAAALESLWS
jgi:pimeloyl-ACP methyl ester carboxylesterase